MKVRIISAVLALPILIFILIKGGHLLIFAALLLSLIGLYEYFNIFKNEKINKWAPYFVTIAWFFGVWANFDPPFFNFLIALLVLGLMGGMIFDKVSFEGVAYSVLGFLYVTFNFSHIVKINALDHSFFIWYPFIIAFSSDTFAYFTGKLIGKRPLIKKVSPNKTIEGSIGGVVFATVFSMIYAYIFNPQFLPFAFGLGLIGSILSQLGDLMASKLKRLYQIKDFGYILPGHGGVLDRFDSILVTLPLVYYFMILFNYVYK